MEVIVGTPKSHRARSVPFPKFLAEALARQCEGRSREQLVLGDGHNHITATWTPFRPLWMTLRDSVVGDWWFGGPENRSDPSHSKKVAEYPQWDSNPHLDDFKSSASADWAMGARASIVAMA